MNEEQKIETPEPPPPRPMNRRERRATAAKLRRARRPVARIAIVPGEGRDLTREGNSGGEGMHAGAGIKGHAVS